MEEKEMAKENTAAVSSEKEITEEEQAPKKKIKKNADLLPSKKEKMTVGQIILLALLFLFTVFCLRTKHLLIISMT